MPTSPEPPPLQLETIGMNPDQESIDRPDGYPCFHWLQTLRGEGEIAVQGAVWRLPERSGFLLYPNTPHAYHSKSPLWQTGYITFTGTMAASFTNSLHGAASGKFVWDRDHDVQTQHLVNMLELAESGADPAGWTCSSELYKFLALLKTNGRINRLPSLSKRLERIQQLLDWLEKEFANPDLGLADMAQQLSIGARQLNDRFRESFGQTAYAYLIQLRLRKAKEWLPARTDLTVRQIAEAVGFRDVSHFIAIFRQKEGLTPEKYRRLHSSS